MRNKWNEEQDFSFTLNQCKVYATLINMDNPHFPRTAEQARNLIIDPRSQKPMSKSTISDIIQTLIKRKVIVSLGGRTNILYRPGIYKAAIETLILNDHILHGQWFDKNGEGIRPIRGTEGTPYYVPSFRVHINGGGFQFTVTKEGQICNFDIPNPSKNPKKGQKVITKDLFGSKAQFKSNKRGSKTIYGSWNFGEGIEGYGTISYQKTSRGGMYFYIQAPNVRATAEEIMENAPASELFMRRIRPFLALLEKRAGWRFLHEDNGDYAITGGLTGKNGSSLEYGFDAFSSNLIKESMGDQIGYPGQTAYWADKSPDAYDPQGEFEAKKAVYVWAFDRLPETARGVTDLRQQLDEVTRSSASIQAAYTQKITELQHQIQKDRAAMWKELCDIQTSIGNQLMDLWKRMNSTIKTTKSIMGILDQCSTATVAVGQTAAGVATAQAKLQTVVTYLIDSQKDLAFMFARWRDDKPSERADISLDGH